MSIWLFVWFRFYVSDSIISQLKSDFFCVWRFLFRIENLWKFSICSERRDYHLYSCARNVKVKNLFSLLLDAVFLNWWWFTVDYFVRLRLSRAKSQKQRKIWRVLWLTHHSMPFIFNNWESTMSIKKITGFVIKISSIKSRESYFTLVGICSAIARRDKSFIRL